MCKKEHILIKSTETHDFSYDFNLNYVDTYNKERQFLEIYIVLCIDYLYKNLIFVDMQNLVVLADDQWSWLTKSRYAVIQKSPLAFINFGIVLYRVSLIAILTIKKD